MGRSGMSERLSCTIRYTIGVSERKSARHNSGGNLYKIVTLIVYPLSILGTYVIIVKEGQR